MVCVGKGQSSVLDPADKIPLDENKTKSSHGYCLFPCDSCVNLYKSYGNFHNQTFPP